MDQKEQNPTVIVYGDLIWDCFVYGNVSRISPEAPNVILDYERTEIVKGGAYNVAAHLRNLNTSCIFISIDGINKNNILDFTISNEHPNDFIIPTSERLKTIKSRFIANYKRTTLLRVDNEDRHDLTKSEHTDIYNIIKKCISSSIKVFCVCDYGKGAVTKKIFLKILELSKIYKFKILVDTKTNNLEKFFGADIIKPNQHEINNFKRFLGVENAKNEEVIKKIWTDYKIPEVILTLGSEGIEYYINGELKRKLLAIRAIPKELSGAGDSALACIAYSITKGGHSDRGIHLAVKGASKFISEGPTYRLSELDILE